MNSGGSCKQLFKGGKIRKRSIKQYAKLFAFSKKKGESVAKEVLKYREEVNTGHFASSTQPRIERKPQVKFRVGQVLKHKKFGYRGVIVGWDETTKAPEFWINQMHGKTNPKWRDQPNYSG